MVTSLPSCRGCPSWDHVTRGVGLPVDTLIEVGQFVTVICCCLCLSFFFLFSWNHSFHFYPFPSFPSQTRISSLPHSVFLPCMNSFSFLFSWNHFRLSCHTANCRPSKTS
uniref:Uncharacterized protein n=1 Tax=Cacopsylla melanoneura TaxID=428564 RepID=A0A8D8Q249_9HEMI